MSPGAGTNISALSSLGINIFSCATSGGTYTGVSTGEQWAGSDMNGRTCINYYNIFNNVYHLRYFRFYNYVVASSSSTLNCQNLYI